MSNVVKFSFIRDPRCPSRVLTVARSVEDDVVSYHYCTNKVVEVDFATLPYWIKDCIGRVIQHETASSIIMQGNAVLVLDKFDKKLGKRIAEGRLHKNPFQVARDEFSPYITALYDIRDNTGDKTAALVASNYLEEYFMEE